MKILIGNILDIKYGAICHQVNCRRVAGAGLALQIKSKWPEWYTYYQKTNPTLGTTTIFPLQYNQGIWILSLYAQENYGHVKRYTNYDAFRKCLRDVNWFTGVLHEHPPVYFPYGIGCGLGGGQWSIIEKIIEEEVPTAIIVKLSKENK